MAKKSKKSKKSTKSKKVEVTTEKDRNIFGAIALGIALIILGALLLLGSFNTGGSLPIGLYKIFDWMFGWTAYILPIVFIYLGFVKLRHEDKIIPLSKKISAFVLLLSLSAVFHLLTYNDKLPATEVDNAGKGGFFGNFLGGLFLNFLDKIPSLILFIVVALLMLAVVFSISLKKLFKPKDNSESQDIDLNTLKEKQFQLNEGVPTIHHSKGSRDDNSDSQTSNQKTNIVSAGSNEDHPALTTTTDENWKFPSLDLLNQTQDKADAGDVQGTADIIKETFSNFNISVDMEGANVGPRITQYTLRPPNGVKLTKITALENNLALDLAAHSIRIEAPIPGKRLVGIEVPNITSATVTLHGLLTTREWQSTKSRLGFAVGRNIAGGAIVVDLEDMPHLLIAGQTKAGKSVMINTLLASLLYRNSPSDLKLILIDPKHVEMAPYEDIPHLIAPVITEPEKCMSALKWAVAEMERRLKTFAEVKQRDIQGYNSVKKEEGMPHIVIVIDELAELMMLAARDVEALIARIAQKARAAGIHLVLATQRPDANIVTGLIKANVPGRIAFAVQDQVNSRIIIDSMGAEKLLGKGDMLLKTTDIPRPIRIQGCLITSDETNKLCDFLRSQSQPNYDDEVMSQPVQFNGKGGIVAPTNNNDADDDMWEDAVRVVIEARKASTSLLQRRLRVGYGRAARLIESMEEQGIIGPSEGSKPRDVLVSSMDEVFGGSSTIDNDDVYDDMPDEEER